MLLENLEFFIWFTCFFCSACFISFTRLILERTPAEKEKQRCFYTHVSVISNPSCAAKQEFGVASHSKSFKQNMFLTLHQEFALNYICHLSSLDV